jgi:hypothetical protein
MHKNRYLHLPIVKDGVIYGMVDVLKLTYHLLEQIHEMENQNEKGPMWSKFWDEESSKRGSDLLSSPVENLNRSVFSFTDEVDTIAPDDSASMILPGNIKATEPVAEHDLFVFKFKDELANKTTRFTSHIRDLDAIKAFISNKMFHTYGGNHDKAMLELCYVDEDNDFVHLTSWRDLEDGVLLARGLGWKSLVIMLDRKRMNFNRKPMLPNHLKLDGPIQLSANLDLAFPIIVSSAILVAALYLLSKPFRI